MQKKLSHDQASGANVDVTTAEESIPPALMLDLAKSVIDARGRENDVLRHVILVQQRHVAELELRLAALASGSQQ